MKKKETKKRKTKAIKKVVNLASLMTTNKCRKMKTKKINMKEQWLKHCIKEQDQRLNKDTLLCDKAKGRLK